MRKPRNYLVAELTDPAIFSPGPYIYINAMKVGGSWGPVSPRQARKIGKRLIEMADYVDYCKRKRREGEK